MSYIGNLPTNVAFVTDTFSGNGSTVAFTTSVAPASTSSILVSVTGVLQDPSTYSVSGTTLTFSAAPPSGTGNISVRYLGIPASGVTTTAYRTVTEFTATAGQTTFSVPSYTAGYIDVYRNGSRLGTADYTATNGTTVVLAAACNAGDLVVTESFYVSSVLNAIPATAGAVNSTYLNTDAVTTAKIADLNVTTAKIADANVTAAKLSTGAPSWDSSGNLSFNSGYGSVATAYGCRAWVNFNQQGTQTIYGSGKVSSITDLGVGSTAINFATAMVDTNYAQVVGVGDFGIMWNGGIAIGMTSNGSKTTSLTKLDLSDPSFSYRDYAEVSVAIFR